QDVGATVSAGRAAPGGVTLRAQDALDQPREVVALESAHDQARDTIPRALLQVEVGGFVGLGRGSGGRQYLGGGFRLPTVLLHRLQPCFRVVPLNAADGHESAEGVEQVLAKMAARNRLANPLHGTPVEERRRAGWLKGVIPSQLPDLDSALCFEWEHDPVAY